MFGEPKYSVLLIQGCFQTKDDFEQDIALAVNLPDMEPSANQCCVVFKDKPHEEFLADVCLECGWSWKEHVPIGKWERHESALVIHAPFNLVRAALASRECELHKAKAVS